VTELVVGAALLLVGENVIGLLNFGESLGRVRGLVHIGMELPCESAICRANLVGGGASGNTQDFVVVA